MGHRSANLAPALALLTVLPLTAGPLVARAQVHQALVAAAPLAERRSGEAAPRTNPLQESQQRFQPTWSARGVVASQEGQASAAGAAVLRRGGNAVDGAVATAFALAVTLPQAGNLGGGGFLLLWLPGVSPARARGCLPGPPGPPGVAGATEAARAAGAAGSPELELGRGYAVAVNFRESAPAAAGPGLFLRADGEVDRLRATRSLQSTAVPGSVAGLLLAQRCYGRLPLAAVLAPAIALAEHGVVVDRELADSLEAALPLLRADPTSRALFLRSNASSNRRPNGTPRPSAEPEPASGTGTAGEPRALRPGERLRQPLLAATLGRIARGREAGFYRGPVAQALLRLMEQRGGLIRAADLEAYRAQLVRPLAGSFGGHPLLSMPPPGGGLTLLQLLGLLEPHDLAASGAGSAASLHQLTEAMNLAYRDRNTWLGDPDHQREPLPDLLAPTYLDQLRLSIDPYRHRPAASLAGPPNQRRESVNTTHLSVADRSGGLVALTTTLNFAYGNGVSVPGAGFLLNNEMDDFTAAPGRPNAFGLMQGQANAIAPGRRPLSSMAPTLVFYPDGRPWLATGSPGGSRIITTVAQVLLQRVVWGANLATAVAAPRIHSQLWPDQLGLEEGVSPDTRRLLEAMGHSLQTGTAMGAANSVEVLTPLGSGSLGMVDPRRGRTVAVAE
jgi:gamma-glutamyltranspeptidase/glutathione hydrolase